MARAGGRSKQADERRRAVEAIGDSRAAREPWAASAFDTIARTDDDELVRAAAVRGRGLSAGPETVERLLPLLSPAASKECKPAPARVRWETARVLRDLCTAHELPDPPRSAAAEALLARLAGDADRNVRITAAEALGHLPDRRVPAALVAVLSERDFALESAAARSLRELTGQSIDCDAAAWQEWLAKTPDPFAERGRRAEGRPWWQWWRR
ncbi:MAG: HEAT repeat domain-containing protein [Phycisphaerae bacterium]